MNLTFLGSGSFGTALAVIFSQYNFNIKMYDRNADVVLGINRDKRNIKYLKNILPYIILIKQHCIIFLYNL